jgi:hypothetical protein
MTDTLVHTSKLFKDKSDAVQTKTQHNVNKSYSTSYKNDYIQRKRTRRGKTTFENKVVH